MTTNPVCDECGRSCDDVPRVLCSACNGSEAEELAREERARLRTRITELEAAINDALPDIGNSEKSLRAYRRLTAVVPQADPDEFPPGGASGGVVARHRRRERLGKLVHDTWLEWVREHPASNPSWSTPWAGLSEVYRELVMRIGERLASAGRDERSPAFAILAATLQVEQDAHSATRKERNAIAIAARTERDEARAERDEARTRYSRLIGSIRTLASTMRAKYETAGGASVVPFVLDDILREHNADTPIMVELRRLRESETRLRAGINTFIKAANEAAKTSCSTRVDIDHDHVYALAALVPPDATPENRIQAKPGETRQVWGQSARLDETGAWVLR